MGCLASLELSPNLEVSPNIEPNTQKLGLHPLGVAG